MIDSPNKVVVPPSAGATFNSQAVGFLHLEIDRRSGAVMMVLRGYPCNDTAWAPTGLGDVFQVADCAKEFAADPQLGPLLTTIQTAVKTAFETMVARRRAGEVAPKT